jgi:hypothetical protein
VVLEVAVRNPVVYGDSSAAQCIPSRGIIKVHQHLTIWCSNHFLRAVLLCVSCS